jgi:hypothetical protein
VLGERLLFQDGGAALPGPVAHSISRPPVTGITAPVM